MKRLTMVLLTCCILCSCFSPSTGIAETDINTYFGWPVSNKLVYCLDCYSDGTQHTGIDIAATKIQVNAVAAGKVVRTANGCPHIHGEVDGVKEGANHNCNGKLGNYVAVEHTVNGQKYTSVYGHLTQNSIVVKVGDPVIKGQKLGISGSSGASTGYHLHLAIFKGTYASGTSELKRKSFQFYLQNTAVLQGMTFNKHVSTSSKLFGSWVKEHCVLNKSNKWSYAGGGAIPNPAKAINSSNGLHQYVRYDGTPKWTDAEAFCESKGGHLATITNQTEQNDVLSVLNGCAKNVYFIGGSDVDKEGTWTWVTKEPFSYYKWDTDYKEPSNASGENYAAIMGKNVGKNKQIGDWIDIFNTGDTEHDGYALYESGFICEYDYVVFNANGGSNAPAKQQKRLNTNLTLTENKPKRTGFTFRGWATSANATTAQYQAGGIYTGNTGAILYAVWAPMEVTTVLTLPAELTTIESEAFVSVGASAIIIPASVTTIAENAFSEDVILIGEEGGVAQMYAQKYGISFLNLNEYHPTSEDQ